MDFYYVVVKEPPKDYKENFKPHVLGPFLTADQAMSETTLEREAGCKLEYYCIKATQVFGPQEKK
jgi:hypothetical protein